MKYIDVNKLKEKIYAEDTVSLAHGSLPEFDQGCHHAFLTVLSFIDSLQQEQQDFPTTDEQIKEFLATHPKVEVPEKYKTPNWLFDKQPSEDLEEAAEEYADKHGFRVPYDGSNNYYDDVDVKASKEGFVAEAKWQAKQLLKSSPLPEDTVLFKKGVEEGRRLERDDLALSIDDIEKIHVFLYAVKNNKQGMFTFTRLSDEQYKEVLRRFKEAKK